MKKNATLLVALCIATLGTVGCKPTVVQIQNGSTGTETTQTSEVPKQKPGKPQLQHENIPPAPGDPVDPKPTQEETNFKVEQDSGASPVQKLPAKN